MTVDVNAGDKHYHVLIAPGLLTESGAAIAKTLSPGRCAIISDSNIALLFAERIQKSLTTAGFDPALITVPAGEQSKTLGEAERICDRMLEAGLDRHSFVVGLGGGVIGDLSGFVASIFQRGIPHVQIPTTLLAMVDSSIGGKTGVNTKLAKNMVGSIHHPSLVIDDLEVLKTLPPREFTQGFAEIIKHAVIADEKMFHYLTKIADSELDRFKRSSFPDDFGGLVRRNIEIKARFVATDELDRKGDRALLNFGHTVAHGIERAGGYREILHGEAVSLGIVAAASISVKRAGLSSEQRDSIVALLKRFGLPTRLPKNLSREQILEALKFDKKFERGEIRFVLTPRIGTAQLSRDVTMEDIREGVNAL